MLQAETGGWGCPRGGRDQKSRKKMGTETYWSQPPCAAESTTKPHSSEELLYAYFPLFVDLVF